MSIKTSIIDKWNEFAKKKITINDSLEVSVGRLVYVSIITGVQVISLVMAGVPLPSVWILFSNFILALKSKGE